MKIEISDEGTANQTIIIRGIEGDMGEEERMNLIQQPDGDVIVSIGASLFGSRVEFCTSNGGGRRPIIAKKLRELVSELMK